MFFKGDGMPVNKKKAAYWIRKAFDNGNPRAKDLWEDLELWQYE